MFELCMPGGGGGEGGAIARTVHALSETRRVVPTAIRGITIGRDGFAASILPDLGIAPDKECRSGAQLRKTV